MFRSGTCLGVDIGSQYIKVVLLRKAGRRCLVEHATRLTLPGGGDAGDIATALGQFINELAIPLPALVCSLPTHACSIKFSQVPKARPADLARVISFEAESQIPLPLNELVWNYRVTGGIESEKNHVVIAAVRRALVQERLSALEELNWRPAALSVAALAGANAVASSTGDAPALVVDIGAEWTDLTITDGTRVCTCRSVKLGRNDLLAAVARDFRLTPAEAERYCSEHDPTRGSGPANGEPHDARETANWLSTLEREIRLSLEPLPTGICPRPQRIALIGEAATVPGLGEAISRKVRLPVTVSDPWQDMELSPSAVRTLTEPASVFAVATGLAMAGLEQDSTINLMPRQFAVDRAQRRNRTLLASGLGVVILALLLVNWLIADSVKQKEAGLHRLQQQVQQLEEGSRREGPNYSAIATAVGNMVETMGKQEHDPLEILRRCSARLPKEIGLTEFSFQDGKTLVMKGRALSNTAVADSVTALTRMEIFTNAMLDYSNLVTDEGQSGYDFQITCTLPAVKGTKMRKKSTGASTEQQTGMIVR